MRALNPETTAGPLLREIYDEAAERVAHAAGAGAPEGSDGLDEDVVLAEAPDHVEGDLAFACFPLARVWRDNPAKIAAAMAETANAGLGEGSPIERFVGVGPYLNVVLDRHVVARRLLAEIAAVPGDDGEGWGGSRRQAGQRVMMEYVSPNTNKPLHLGHVRNAVLGRSVARLVESQGAEVFLTEVVNDRGIHIVKSMIAYERWGEGETPESSGVKGDHFVGRFYVRFDRALHEEREAWLAERDADPASLGEREAKELEERFLEESDLMGEARDMLQRWEAGDEEVRALWSRMNGWVYDGFAATHERLGIRFDKHYYESEIFDGGKEIVHDALERGVFERAENGAVVAPLSEHPELGENLHDKVMLRADGTGLYITQDVNLATVKFREYDLDRSLYCIGSEQDYYMRQLLAVLKLLGYGWAEDVHHLSYGMVYLPEGKMKSREGKVVDADDLVDGLAEMAKDALRERYENLADDEIARRAEAIGLAAIVFNFLLVGRDSDIHFDPAASLSFEGKTGPYLQYAYARIASILRKAGEDAGAAAIPEKLELGDDAEWALVRALLYLPTVIADAAESYDPSRLAAHLVELAQRFNAFYHDHPVLQADEPNRASRLALLVALRRGLATGLHLLAIEPLEEM